MDIYVGRGKKEKDFINLVENLKCISTKEQLLNSGFTNYNKPYLYLHKNIDKKYDITFNMTLYAKSLEIKDIMIMDEDFGQPYLVTEKVFEESKKIIDWLIDVGLFSKKVV